MPSVFKDCPKLISLLLGAVLVVGCANVETQQEAASNRPSNALGNIEFHTAELADELFYSFGSNQQYRYAIVGFVPVASLKYAEKMQHPLMLLGHQLEQGLMTEASRRGFITQDFKVSDGIMLNETSDSVMSRDGKKLAGTISADFYITGTITEQQEGAIVNARVIHAKSKDVVAAATKFFPA